MDTEISTPQDVARGRPTDRTTDRRIDRSSGGPDRDRAPNVAPAYLRPIIAVDGAGSGVLGVTLLVAPGWLATGLGLATELPVQVMGLLLVLNAVVNGRAAARPSWARLVPCVVVDLTFAGMLLGLVVADPWDSSGWSRWSMAGLALLSFDVGLLKLWATRGSRD